MRQHAFLVVGLALCAFGLGIVTPAPAQQAPIGAWEVRHGQLGEVFVFAVSGQYSHQIYSAQFGTLTTQAEERGTFTVEGSRMILRPSHGGVRTFQWRIGTSPVAVPGEAVLYLSESGGPERMLFGRRP